MKMNLQVKFSSAFDGQGLVSSSVIYYATVAYTCVLFISAF